MSGGVKREFYAVDIKRLAIFRSFHANVAEPVPYQRNGIPVTKIILRTPAGMIGMRVGQNSLADRFPGIDIYSCLFAKNAFVCEFKEFHWVYNPVTK